MKINAFGPPPQPDPKDDKRKVSKQPDKPVGKLKPGSDTIDLAKGNIQSKQTSYNSRTHKSNVSNGKIKKDIVGLRQKSSFGHYDSIEVINKTSEKIIDSEELKDVVKQYHLSSLGTEKSAKTAAVRHEKIAEVKARINEGFFDNSENFGAIADKIIDHFGI